MNGSGLIKILNKFF